MIKKPIELGALKIVIKELSDGLYTIVNDRDGSWIVNKKMTYSEVIEAFERMRRKAELLNNGYEHEGTIEFTNGFKRVSYLHKIFDTGVPYIKGKFGSNYTGDIYIYGDGKKVNLLVNVRYMGEEYNSSFECDSIIDITNGIIEDRIEDVKTTLREVMNNEL